MVKCTCLLIVAATILSAAGCASLSLPFMGSKQKQEIIHATLSNPVKEMITLWEPGEGRGLDNLPTRGFAGQVLFFTYMHPTPAMVDGHVTVYVFDDRGTNQEQSHPLWQHTFTPEEWNSLSLQTNLGTAYQMFIPYTRKGQHEAHCSVRLKFEPTDGGPPVYSKMANVVLPGDKTELPKPTMTRKRIEPQRFDAGPETAMRPLTEPPAQEHLRTSSVTLPGRRDVNVQTAARLQQFAQDMVRTQHQSSGIEQAAYFTESAAAETAEEPASSEGTRYQLHR